MTAALLAYCRAAEMASSPWEGLLGTRRAALLRKELWNSQGGGKPQMGVGRELASPPTALPPPTSLPMGRGQQEEGLQPILQRGGRPPRGVWVLWVGRAGSLAEAAQRLQRV